MSITLTSPEAAVAAAPYLIGFTPADSLVIMLIDEDGLRMTMRIDLPDCPEPHWLINVVDALGDPPPGKVMLIVYADTVPLPFATGIADWTVSVIEPLTEVLDCQLVHDGRFRSLYGRFDDTEGSDLGSVANHPVVAACVAAGMARLESRDHVVALLDPVADEVTEQVATVLGRARTEPYERWRDRTELTALALLRANDSLNPEDVALLGRACCDVFVRDPLIALLTGDAVDRDVLEHARVRLLYAVTHLPDGFAGGVAATIALVSWMLGDWATAYAGADRAKSADPNNTLAPLVLEALLHRLPPDTWETLTREIPLEVLRGRHRRTA